MIGAKIDESPKYVLFSTNTIEKIAANIGVEFNHPQLSLIIANDLTFQLRKQVEIAKRRAKKQRLKRLTSFVDPHTNTPSRSSTIDHVALLNKNLKHQIYLPKITIQPDLLILNKYSISSRLNRPVKIQRSRQLLGNRHNSSWLRCLCQTRPPSPLKILWKKSLPKRGNFVFSHFSNWFHRL